MQINYFFKQEFKTLQLILNLVEKTNIYLITKWGSRSFHCSVFDQPIWIFMEKAVLASSKYVNFDKPDKPDSVVSFFKNHGFTESQIRKMVAFEPRILSCNPQNTLLPKMEFFRSKGYSEEDLARILVSLPSIFIRSLKNCIVPSFNFIEAFLASQNDAIFAMSHCARILVKLEYAVKPSIEILSGAGMCRCTITRLLRTEARVFANNPDKLKESVKQVQNMRMHPESCCYGLALPILCATRRSTWDKRMEAFKRWGCSEDVVLTSFKIFPFIMMVSEEKLYGIMSLFVHEMGWEACEVVRKYFMLTMSLKKNDPRWLVYQELVSKGLVKKANFNIMFIVSYERGSIP